MSVWEQVADNRYKCVVTRTADYLGELTVTDTKTNKQLLKETVHLSFGARFGPDVGDVLDWQDKAVTVIDASLAQSEER